MRRADGSQGARPGPRGLPLLGSYPAFRRDMLGFSERIAREHGDAAFFRLGTIPCVQLNRPAWIQQVLTKDGGRTKKSWDMKELEVALGKGLLTNEGEDWRRQRRRIQPAFHNERIRGYGRIMVEHAHAMLDGWADGQRLDLSQEMSRVTLGIVGRSLFGADVGEDARVVADSLDVVMERFAVMMTSWVPVPMTWPTPGNLRARRAIERMDQVVFRMVSERRAGSGQGDDLLSWLLEAQHAEEPLSDRQLRDELVTLLLAGHETTALALSWTLMLLARHPEVETRLLEELDAVLGERALRADDEPRLVYTRQVVEEGMRLYPPAWGIGREALEDIALADEDGPGPVIPRGTQIFLAQWVTHRDPRFFHEPERFDPDRWSEERRASIPRYAYFPFGGGPRVCIGMHFAMLEATLLLAAVVRRFRVELVPGHPIELEPSVTLRPRHGIRAQVHARRGGPKK